MRQDFPVTIGDIRHPLDVSLCDGGRTLLLGEERVPLGEKEKGIVAILLERGVGTWVEYDEIMETMGEEPGTRGDGEYDRDMAKSQLRTYYFAARRTNEKIARITSIQNFLKFDDKAVSIDSEALS